MTGELKLMGSSSGSTTLLPPTSGSDRTITFPNNAGTVITNATPGTILQVVSINKTDTFTGYGTTWFDITGVSLAITPTATSSKILVQVNMPVSVTNAMHAATRLVRDSTPLLIGDAEGSNRLRCTFGAYWTISDVWNVAITYLDSPNTTSSTTYKMQGYTHSSAQSLAVNRNGYTTDVAYALRWASSITAMEVAG